VALWIKAWPTRHADRFRRIGIILLRLHFRQEERAEHGENQHSDRRGKPAKRQHAHHNPPAENPGQ